MIPDVWTEKTSHYFVGMCSTTLKLLSDIYDGPQATGCSLYHMIMILKLWLRKHVGVLRVYSLKGM